MFRFGINKKQVVDLEAIHEHFKVCLADPAPDRDGSSGEGVAKEASREVPPKTKKRRMVGTSVKGTSSTSKK